MKGRIEMARLYEDHTWDTQIVEIDWDDPIWTPIRWTDDKPALAARIAERYTEVTSVKDIVLATPYHYNYDELLMLNSEYDELYGEVLDD